ncbi:hypothetical protein HDU93_007415 [Gonapodya sp. JEL0774]|nr:hypothetical protein HDU93_007415 [Gonapodya sp. JEL0774]
MAFLLAHLQLPTFILKLLLPNELLEPVISTNVPRELLEVNGVPVLFRPPYNLPESDPHYDGPEFTERILPVGWRLDKTTRPLDEAIILTQNVTVKMRDDVSLMVDILRPAGRADNKFPAIIMWTPYGKTFRGKFSLNVVPYRAGVRPAALSGLEVFEGLDPAEWCPRGYAIVHVDCRGSYDSGGNLTNTPGGQTITDGYDVVEWIAAQEWCNGKVGMSGNSQLAMSQYWVAESQPPHLAAIAPWEGLADEYRQNVYRGGIPNFQFAHFVFSNTQCTRTKVEDSLASFVMPGQDGFFRNYALTKAAKPSKIVVPIYATAAMGSTAHLLGSITAWKNAASIHKWLRFHGGQEWHDLHQRQNVEDLAGFFDHFLKGIDNKWPDRTPPVRYQVHPHGGDPVQIYQVASDFPPPDVREWSLSLTRDGVLSKSPLDVESWVEYDSANNSSVASWTYIHSAQASTTLEFVGLPRVCVHAAAESHTDFDLCFTVRKLSREGKPLDLFTYPLQDMQRAAIEMGQTPPTSYESLPKSSLFRYVGPNGLIRASRRKVRPPASREEIEINFPGVPFHPHDENTPVKPGEIVEIVTGLWPMAMSVSPGEGLRLDITPVNSNYSDIPVPIRIPQYNANKGKQLIYFGGKYKSQIWLPLRQGTARSQL